jgi:hypothetical protein
MQVPSAVRTEKARRRFPGRGLLEIFRCLTFAGDLPDVSNARHSRINRKRKELSRYSGSVVGMAVICPTCQVGYRPVAGLADFPDLMLF